MLRFGSLFFYPPFGHFRQPAPKPGCVFFPYPSHLQVTAVFEALRLKGHLPGGGDGAAAGAAAEEARGYGGGIMLSCDPPLARVLGASAFPFSQLEEALSPHVDPAPPPSVVASIS